MKTYRPSGRAALVAAKMAAEPEREFLSRECAEIMGCTLAAVAPTLLYAVKNGVIRRRNVGKFVLWRYGEEPEAEIKTPVIPKPVKPVTTPPKAWVFDPSDPRIMRVIPGWVPPQMRCVRLGE